MVEVTARPQIASPRWAPCSARIRAVTTPVESRIHTISMSRFAASSGTTRAPFLLEMADDLSVSMPLVANLVSVTATAWGVASAVAGSASDRVGRRALLVGGLLALALVMVAQAMAGTFLWVAFWATAAGGCAGTFTGVVFAEFSA